MPQLLLRFVGAYEKLGESDEPVTAMSSRHVDVSGAVLTVIEKSWRNTYPIRGYCTSLQSYRTCQQVIAIRHKAGHESLREIQSLKPYLLLRSSKPTTTTAGAMVASTCGSRTPQNLSNTSCGLGLLFLWSGAPVLGDDTAVSKTFSPQALAGFNAI